MSLKRGGFVFTCDFCKGQTVVNSDALPDGWGDVSIAVKSFDRSPDRGVHDSKYHQRYGDTYNKHVCNDCIDHETFTITIGRSRQLSIANERGSFTGGVQRPYNKQVMGMDDELYGKGI